MGSVGHGTRCEISSLWPSDTEQREVNMPLFAIEMFRVNF